MSGTDPDVLRRIARLEHQMNALMRHNGIEVPEQVPGGPAVSDRVRELALAGNTIQAIKAYREETGCDLIVAKDVVESI